MYNTVSKFACCLVEFVLCMLVNTGTDRFAVVDGITVLDDVIFLLKCNLVYVLL